MKDISGWDFSEKFFVVELVDFPCVGESWVGLNSLDWAWVYRLDLGRPFCPWCQTFDCQNQLIHFLPSGGVDDLGWWLGIHFWRLCCKPQWPGSFILCSQWMCICNYTLQKIGHYKQAKPWPTVIGGWPVQACGGMLLMGGLSRAWWLSCLSLF